MVCRHVVIFLMISIAKYDTMEWYFLWLRVTLCGLESVSVFILDYIRITCTFECQSYIKYIPTAYDVLKLGLCWLRPPRMESITCLYEYVPSSLYTYTRGNHCNHKLQTLIYGSSIIYCTQYLETNPNESVSTTFTITREEVKFFITM
jgi:hypothetical protein